MSLCQVNLFPLTHCHCLLSGLNQCHNIRHTNTTGNYLRTKPNKILKNTFQFAYWCIMGCNSIICRDRIQISVWYYYIYFVTCLLLAMSFYSPDQTSTFLVLNKKRINAAKSQNKLGRKHKSHISSNKANTTLEMK